MPAGDDDSTDDDSTDDGQARGCGVSVCRVPVCARRRGDLPRRRILDTKKPPAWWRSHVGGGCQAARPIERLAEMENVTSTLPTR